jgi:DNA-binding PadR family transcriptional regulator
MSPVFGHGRLRLYLLKLLSEQPRHGYEIIRLLENHFEGMYAPSAGTIYPRLARLEGEGLVTHSRERGRKVYQLTDAGLEELDRRQDELEAIEEEIDDSAAGLADLAREIHQGVLDTVQGLKHDLRLAKAEFKQELNHGIKHELRQTAWDAAAQQFDQLWGAGSNPRFDRLLAEFGKQARRLASTAQPTEAQLGECVAILDEALDRLRAALTRAD